MISSTPISIVTAPSKSWKGISPQDAARWVLCQLLDALPVAEVEGEGVVAHLAPHYSS